MHTLVNALQESLKGDLIKENHQHPMRVPGRITSEEANRLKPPPRVGSVLLLVYPEHRTWNMVLIKRTDYDGVHGGQVSFPGGKQEQTDPDLYGTALRESREEIGLNEPNLISIGKLSNLYIPPSHFMVHPFVALLPHRPSLVADAREVESIIHAPLDLFIGTDKVSDQHVFIGKNNPPLKVPAYSIEKHIVWGATAMIISEFIAICAPVLKKY